MVSQEPWSRKENRDVVHAYLDMLSAQLEDHEVVKARFNRRVQEATGRRRGSVEFKFQNISAVLAEVDVPFVSGYKPAKNYQSSLREEVLRQLQGLPWLTPNRTSTLSRPTSERAESPIPLQVRSRDEAPRGDLQSDEPDDLTAPTGAMPAMQMTEAPALDRAAGRAITRLLSVRRHTQDGVASVHKPMLMILALAHLASVGSSELLWSRTKLELGLLIHRFGVDATASEPKSAAYPFTRLRSDGIWSLSREVTMDSVAQLDAAPVTGRFIEAIEDPLRERGQAEHVMCALAVRAFETRSDEVLEAVASSVLRIVGKENAAPSSEAFTSRLDRYASFLPSPPKPNATTHSEVSQPAAVPPPPQEADVPCPAPSRPWDELRLSAPDRAVVSHLLLPGPDGQPRTVSQAAQDLDMDRTKVAESWRAARHQGQVLCHRYGWPQELVHAMVRLGHVATFSELVREAGPALSAVRGFTRTAAFGLTRIAVESHLVPDLSWRRSGDVVILGLAEGNRRPDDLVDAAIVLSSRLQDLLGSDDCVPDHVALKRSERDFETSGLGSVPLARRTRLITSLTPGLAMSSRHEIYRRGLRFDLALRLFAGTLSPTEGPSTEDLVDLVRSRFPAVGRVPSGAALDRAIEAARLTYTG